MIKSIWEKIKLAFERKPASEIYKVDINVPTLPPAVKFDDTTLSHTGVTKPKRVRKPKNESA
jgi:hypothetical protein